MRRVLLCLIPLVFATALTAQVVTPTQTNKIAQSDADSAAPALPASQADAIASALKTLPTERGLTTAQRQQAATLLQQASDDETHADELAQQWQQLRQSAGGADAAAQKLDTALASDSTAAQLAWHAALPKRASVERLEALLAQERDALVTARNASATLDTEISRQSARPEQLRDELAAAHAALDQFNATLADPTAPVPLRTAQVLHTQAAQRLATIQIALLELESRSYEPRMRLLSAQLREHQRTTSQLRQRVAALESLVLDRIGADVTDLCARVNQERTDIGTRSHLLADAAETNTALCDQLADAIARIGVLRAQKLQLDSAQQNADQALTNTQQRIRIGGVSEAVGLILLAEQRKLKPLPQLKRQLVTAQTELAKARMALIDLRERQDALTDISASVARTLAPLADIPDDIKEKLRVGLFRLLNTRAELVPRLLAQQTHLASALADTERDLLDLVSTTAKLGTILDARLLWTPSHAPVDLAWAARLAPDSVSFFTAPRWARSVRSGARNAVAMPFRCSVAILVLAGLLWLRRRLPQQLERIAAPMRRIRTDHYRLTGQALAWTLLAAAPVPFALWLLGKLWLHAASNGGGFSDAIGRALMLLALPAAALAFMRMLTVETGLAQYHFRWPRPRRQALHRIAPVLAAIVLPAMFLIVVLARPSSDAPLDTLGRAVLALALGGVGWLGWRLLAPERLWTARDTVLHEPLRLRQIMRSALVMLCAVLALLDLIGYFVTAQVLSAHLLESLGALLGVATLHGLAVRWLVLGERHLALKRMQEKQAESSAASERSAGEAKPELFAVEEVTIASVSAQTRRLLRALTILGTISALLWIWSDVTPALSLLGNITLWDSSQTIAGKDIALHVSLREVLEAMVAFVLTWVATRNLPGLLEVGVLRRLHVDAPTRYAIVAVSRYAIVTIGIIFAIGRLGVHWNQLQWMAAAFTVGLGFGLQEIFANFVSGLIVLFERPFRVGDVISIGDVDGSVARIRTRATTLIDWDNKEVIVPNKTFITDRMVNWTLSDAVTRVVLRISVAYASDPRQVRELLLEIANAETLVIKDPAPSCWFMQISASTFDFDLRVFIAEIGHRLQVTSTLYTRIAEVFRERNIEMSFAQMDVWFRNTLQSAALEPAPSVQPAPSAVTTGDKKRP